MKLAVCILLFATGVSETSVDPWEPIRAQIEKFPLKDYCVSVGDAQHQLFVKCKGNMTMTKQIYMASSSKFPTAGAIMGVSEKPDFQIIA